jgi:hypothetical protein
MWIQGATSKHKGLLRKKLGVKAGHDIPERALEKAEHAKSQKLVKEARLAMTLRKLRGGA